MKGKKGCNASSFSRKPAIITFVFFFRIHSGMLIPESRAAFLAQNFIFRSKNALPFYMSSPPSSPSKHTTNGTEASASAVAPVPAAAVAPQPTAAALNPATIVPQQPTAIPIDPASSKAVLNPAQIQRTKLQNIPAFLNKLYK